MLENKRPHGSLAHHYQFPTNEAIRQLHAPTESVGVQWGNTLCCKRLNDLGESSFLLLGGPRTGKTTLLTLLVKSVLITCSLFMPIRYRALWNDPKRELIPLLGQWGLSRDEHYVICNSADKRASCWNIASDLDRPSRIKEFVEDLMKLFDGSGKSHAFWKSIVVQTLVAIIVALSLRRPGDWELRDVVEVATNNSALKQALNVTPQGRGLWSRVFDAGSRDLPDDALASLHMAVDGFRVTAALWHKAETYFDIKSWKSKGSILVMGYDTEATTQSQITNYLIMKAAAQAVSNSQPTKTDLSWFILDEISSIGQVPKLTQLLDKDHGLGARVVVSALGFLNLETAFEDKRHANEIVACTDNKAILRLEHSEDIERAAKQLGLEWYQEESKQISEDFRNITRSYSDRKRFRFDEVAIANLKAPGRDGIDAIIKTHGLNLPVRTLPPRRPSYAQNKSFLRPVNSLCTVEPGFVRRPPADEYLIPWCEKDYQRFGFTMEEQPTKQKAAQSTASDHTQSSTKPSRINWPSKSINPILKSRKEYQ